MIDINQICIDIKKVEGKVFSEIVTLPTLQKFLNTCEKFWIKKALSENETLKFKSNCMAFYRDKTFERINLFYKNFKKMIMQK